MPNRRTCVKALLVCVLTLAAGFGVSGPALGAPALYLVFEVDEAGAVEAVFSRKVQLAAPLESVDEDRLRAERSLATRRGATFLLVRLEGPDGGTVHRGLVQVPRWTRGEFHGARTARGTRTIEGYRLAGGRRSFVVRVPLHESGTLVLEGERITVFDLADLIGRAASSPPPPDSGVAAGEDLVINGDPANRMDLLLMGDGYDATQEALFQSHVAEFETWFFAMTPYAEYENFVNVNQLFVASPESGADHPPYDPSCTGELSCCADPVAATDPLAGTYVDTAFDARFCASNIHRLLVVNETAVLTAASAVPDWDMIIVAVNDTTYGGSGGSIPVASVHDDGLEIVQHEYGHSFTGLADEYDSAYPGYPPCSDIVGPACEANATDETLRSLVKWEPWIDPGTPVPTPENLPAYADVVGLFEGARYLTTGMYRPMDFACLMHYLGEPSCAVCSQEYVRVLYTGGWGVPAGGIDLVEPGSESPPTGGVVDGTNGVTLSVDLLQPVGAPPLEETWFEDDVPQAPQTGNPPGTFDYASSVPGTHLVRVEVRDVTPLVHPALAGPWLESSREWTVDVGLAAGPGSVATLTVGKSTTTPGNLLMSWTTSCSPGAVDYGIYEGVLGSFYSHDLVDCTDDDADPLSEEIAPSGVDAYYLVVPLTADAEGSYGTSSNAEERPRAATVCRASRVLAACP